MYTQYLSDSLQILSTRYGHLVNNEEEHPVQVCLLNSGGEIVDSIQQAVRDLCLGLWLCCVVVLFHVEWCIRKP